MPPKRSPMRLSGSNRKPIIKAKAALANSTPARNVDGERHRTSSQLESEIIEKANATSAATGYGLAGAPLISIMISLNRMRQQGGSKTPAIPSNQSCWGVDCNSTWRFQNEVQVLKLLDSIDTRESLRERPNNVSSGSHEAVSTLRASSLQPGNPLSSRRRPTRC